MLHVLPHTFKLACVAGIQKGKGKGILGARIPYPSHMERLPHRLV